MLSFCLSLIDNSVCQGVSDIYVFQGLEILILTHCFPSGWGWNCLVNDSFLLRCVCKIAKTDCWLCRDRLCVHPSVHVEQLGSHWMDFYEIWSLSIFLNICGEFSSFIKTWPRIMGTLHEAICTFMIISHQIMGTAVAQWLSCCATNRKVAGSIPPGVSGFFIDIKFFRSHYGPGVDSASNRNKYREYFLGLKAAGA
jgi:hypothetical protein